MRARDVSISFGCLVFSVVLIACNSSERPSTTAINGKPEGIYVLSRSESIGPNSVEEGVRLELLADGTMREGPLVGKWTAYDDHLVVRDIEDTVSRRRFPDGARYAFRGHYGHAIYLRLSNGNLLLLMREASPVRSALIYTKSRS